MGIFAGALADVFNEDNKRVIDNTENALDRIGISAERAQIKSEEKIEENLQRLETLVTAGYTRPQAVSIVRGGVLGVNYAMKKAEEARALGQTPDTWYKTTSEYEPEDFANYTNLQLAEATVDPINLDAIRDAYTKGRKVNMDAINAQMERYATKRDTIDLPSYTIDPDKAAQTDVKTLYSQKLNQQFNLERQIAEAEDDTQKTMLTEKLNILKDDIASIYKFGTDNKIFAGTGFTGAETRTNLNSFLSRGLNRIAQDGKFGSSAIFSLGDNNVLIPKYDPQYRDEVDAQTSNLAAQFVGSLIQNNKLQTESRATLAALGFKIVTITQEIVDANPDLNADDVGKQAVDYAGFLSLIPEGA